MFPRLFEIGRFHVASYGLFVALGYLAGIAWLKKHREAMGLTEDRFWSLIYAVFFGAVLGGKLMFMALNWKAYASGQLGIIGDFRYGFVYYGGVLGCLACGTLYARRVGIPFAPTVDYFAVVAPIGQAIGRIGCLAAGCCYGAPTSLPWGIAFTDRHSLVPDNLLGVKLHPSQLYESLGNLVVAWVVWSVLGRRLEGKTAPGNAFVAYVCLYSILRFLVEFTRADDRGGFFLGLSPAQWTAIVLAAGVLVWNAVRRPEAEAA